MRLRLSTVLGTLMVVGLLATPVASAAPGQSSWESGEVHVFDQCTGETIDGTFNTHLVETDNGPFHFNVHLQAIGETTGSLYVGDTFDNEFGHALPDGTFLINTLVTVRVVSQGSLSNLIVFTLHFHLVVDSDGNVISGFFDTSSGECQGS